MPNQRKAHFFLFIPILIFILAVMTNLIIGYYIQINPEMITAEFLSTAELVMGIFSIVALISAIVGAVMMSFGFRRTLKERKANMQTPKSTPPPNYQ